MLIILRIMGIHASYTWYGQNAGLLNVQEDGRF